MYRFLFAAAALLGACGMGHAEVPQLGGTLWFLVDDPATKHCTIDEIAFSSNGTAAVYYVLEEDPVKATWTLDGASLKLAYDDWPGDFSGIIAANRLSAVDTWQSAKTNTVHQDLCIFERG